MILFMYIAPGKGQTIPWGQVFDVNRKPLSLCPFVAGLKKNALKSDFIYNVFHFHHMYIAVGRGRQSIGDKILMTTERPFFLCPYIASFKMISSKSDFIHIFNDFIHVHIYSPGAKAENPLEQTLDINRKPLSLRSFVASFKQTSLTSDVIHISLMFFHMYIAPGQRQTTLCGQNPDVN